MTMGLISHLAIFFSGTNLNIRDGAQCHRKWHWTLSQKTQVLLLFLPLSNFEKLGKLRPELPSLEFRDDNTARSKETRKS